MERSFYHEASLPYHRLRCRFVRRVRRYAHYFGVDPTVVRVATVLLVAFAGLSLWVYIIAALIMPKEC